MRAITRQRYTRFLHIAKHGTKTGKGLRSSHGFFPSEVSNNMLCDLGRMSRGSALDERNAAHCHRGSRHARPGRLQLRLREDRVLGLTEQRRDFRPSSGKLPDFSLTIRRGAGGCPPHPPGPVGNRDLHGLSVTIARLSGPVVPWKFRSARRVPAQLRDRGDQSL